MAGVNSKEIPDEFNMFGELFTLYKKYYHPDNTDEYWIAVSNDFNSLSKKYGTELSKNLGFTIIEELERKAKGQANV
jgi:hypothetical protein